jgi:hypothetical protein
MANHLFISYKHQEVSANVALRFYQYLSAISGGMGFTIFMDTEIEAAERWSDKIENELEKTTHFVCLLTTSYWIAPQCRRELFFALDKFEKKGTPRILFVLVEDLDPQWFKFDEGTAKVELKGDGPDIKSVGDINFLGPFNENRQLVRLQHENGAQLQDQFFKLAKRIEEVLQ